MHIICDQICERGLPRTSNCMKLKDHNLAVNEDRRLNFFFINYPIIVLTTDQISSQHLFQISRYGLSKSVIWMCVEEPFSQIWSHILFSYFQYCPALLSTHSDIIYYIPFVIQHIRGASFEMLI